MDRTDVAVATIALARDAAEDRLLREALGALTNAGLPVYVADGGSSDAFRDFLAAAPSLHEVAPRAGGLVPQVQASIAAAAGAGRPFVLYTEPDKLDFFARHLSAFIRRAPVGSTITLAARSPAALATFTPIQQFTESVASRLCWDQCGVTGDYFYGPFIMPAALAEIVGAAEEGLGWGWRPFLFGVAARLQHRFVMVDGDYECPPGQRRQDEEERLHRLRQLGQNVDGLVRSATFVLGSR